MALQCAGDYAKKNPNLTSYDILAIAERYRKFLEDGIIEVKP
jgi:hypothetical protein